MKSFFPKPTFKVDDIISYTELVAAEGINLQKGMNFNVKPDYSVLLMSVRKNAPYADEYDNKTGTLIYEGHDVPSNLADDPKKVDQPLTTPKGTITENGKFFTAAQAYQNKLVEHAHKVKVYEKIHWGFGVTKVSLISLMP